MSNEPEGLESMNDNQYNSIVKTLEFIRVFSNNIDMKTCYELFNLEEPECFSDEQGSSQKAA